MIPRIFHRIWLGEEPLPREFEDYGESWRRHHPRWELRLWTEEDLPEGVRPEAAERRRNPAERADILRYELLRRFGGVYVDMDYECLRPIDPLVEGVDFFVGQVSRQSVGNAIIGARAGHPIMERAVAEVRPTSTLGVDKDGTGPGFLDRLLDDFPEVPRYPVEYLYPQRSDDLSGAYAIHHEARTWRTHAELNETVKHLRGRLKELKRRVQARDEELERLEARLAESECRREELERERSEDRAWRRTRRALRLPRLRSPAGRRESGRG